MTEQRDLDRAMTLAEMAPSRSVTFDVLADREPSFDRGRLHDPPVTYLEDTEAPAYALTDAKRGVGVGTKRNTTAPSDGRGTVVLVTGRRTLCLVGGRDDDSTFEIPHEVVADVSYHTGWLRNRLTIRTPRKRYHCWVSRKTDEGLLARAAEYVRERKPEAPYEEPGDEEPTAGEATFSYRGQEVTREQHPGLPDAPVADDPADGGPAGDGDNSPASGPDGGGDATDGESGNDGSEEQPQFSYRGQPVTREQHPGLPDEPPAGTATDAASETDAESASEAGAGAETDPNGDVDVSSEDVGRRERDSPAGSGVTPTGE